MPNVEGRELPGNPYWILLNAPSGTIPNIASPVPYLTGINAQDGSEVIWCSSVKSHNEIKLFSRKFYFSQAKLIEIILSLFYPR